MAASREVTVDVSPDPATWTERIAGFVARAAAGARERGERFRLVLTGGGTPAPLYRRLAEAPWRDRIDWPETDVYMGDERCVPPDEEGSNWGQAERLLLSRVPLPEENRHRLVGEIDPDRAARRAEAEIRRTAGDPPRPDLLLLGMGGDGHVASLFPGSPQLEANDRLVVPGEGPPPWRSRLTMTMPALNSARRVVFLVRGEEKAARVAEVLDQVRRGVRDGLPASRVRPPDGSVHWFLDRDAASRLDPKEQG